MNSRVFYAAKGTAPKPLPEPISYPRAWTRDDLKLADVVHSIPSAARNELDALVASLERAPLPTLVLTPELFELDACREFMASVKMALDNGPGVAVIDRLPVERYGREVSTAVYWILGSLLGRPVAQSWAGLMLYDVKDSGKTHGNGVRGSVTNVELYFHTDNSYGKTPPQYIGLLCLQTARSGGESRLVSWGAVYNTLLREHPELVSRGFEAFLFDRQKEHAPDASMVLSKPSFRYESGQLSVCYSARLMRTGYRMAEELLDEEGGRFLDRVDAILKREDVQLGMHIERGQIQFINNAVIGHSRTAFTDNEDPERKRHLVRMWFREHGRISYDG